jgi:TonB family protein
MVERNFVAEGSRKLVTKVIPQNPGLARAMNIQGTVKADVLVAPTGKVQSVEVKGGHPVLAQAAQDALKQWKWESDSHESHEMVEITVQTLVSCALGLLREDGQRRGPTSRANPNSDLPAARIAWNATPVALHSLSWRGRRAFDTMPDELHKPCGPPAYRILP